MACAGPKHKPAGDFVSEPLIPEAAAPAIPKNANIALIAYDQLSFFEEDDASYLKVYVDRQYAGRTDIAAKSAKKKWGEVLPASRHLFRFEKWNIAPSGNWHMLAPRYQPAEQWLDLSGSSQTIVTLIFSNHGIKHSTLIQERPLSP